jgi:hypothetical protein
MKKLLITLASVMFTVAQFGGGGFIEVKLQGILSYIPVSSIYYLF